MTPVERLFADYWAKDVGRDAELAMQDAEAAGASCNCPAKPGDDCPLSPGECAARVFAASKKDADRQRALENGSDVRRMLLAEIEGLVCRDRNSSYDDARPNFERIAKLANVVLGAKLKEPLNAVDVGLFSVCIKLGRLAHDPWHRDSLLDLCGYGVCTAGIVEQERAG